MATYGLTALLSPAIQVPTSLLLPGTDPAVKALTLTPGATGAGSLSTPFNTNAAHLENLGIGAGAWAYAVRYGLDLSAGSGLTLNISAGAAHIGAVPTVAAAQTKALTDNSNNHVWLLRDGTISLKQNTLDPPATPACYLGRVVTTAGAQGTPDYSGRVELRGGSLYRRTGDAGLPADTPPAGVMILAETAGGLYLWTGTDYWKQVTGGSAAYTVTNGTTDRTFDADTVVVAELADVVATLIADLKLRGLIA